ncbi:VTT domain-containing protein [Nocardioides mesophilus]|uniref:VTT domain-containing protein n=1 Tax=Nocardioides mesophilus TaxID=433659 RepID=A0A7G9RH25_9ACTN|nr:VTT domain-containing protein [Nocardioides mesophilus]
MTPLLLGLDWLDPEKILDQFGDYALWGAAAIIFAECGLLIGFFLPGDSLLFTVGLLLAEDQISYPLWLCCAVLAVAAVAGNACGYGIGVQAGPRVFNREDSRIFKQAYVDKSRNFFEKYGSRAIVLARFVPVVRTFITVIAGVGSMSFQRFITYSAIGGTLWAVGVTLLGYYLGSIPFVKHNVEVMLLAFVLVAVVPVAVEVLRERAAAKLAELTDD